MRLLTIVLAVAAIFSTTHGLNFIAWHPPRRGDVRGPCPALNSLANHGFIRRNGKDITVNALVRALAMALNVSEDLAEKVATGALRTSSSATSRTFNLDDLGKHNIIEHDGSLSRKDLSVDGDNVSFNKEIFEEFLSYFNGTDRITLPAAAAARWGRVQTERARNKNFTYTPEGQFNSYVESASYFEVFKDPETKTVSLPLLKIFFEQERLPFREGWRPVNRLDGVALAANILQIAMFTPEKAPRLEGGEGFQGVEV